MDNIWFSNNGKCQICALTGVFCGYFALFCVGGAGIEPATCTANTY